MDNKEAVYEAEIKPLIKQMYDICKKRGIPFIASFQTMEGELRGTCCIPTEADGRLHMAYAVLNSEIGFSVIGQASDEPMKVHD